MPSALTRLQLRTRVVRTLEVADADTAFWTPAELNDLLNDAQRVMCTKAPLLRKVHTLQADGAFDATYPYSFYVPASGVVIVRAYSVWAGSYRLTRTSVDAEADNSATWEATNGTPTRIIPGDYGFNRWRITPNPSSAATVKMLGSYLPDDMDDDADTPGVPLPLQHYLCDYVCRRALERPGDRQDLEQARVFEKAWGEGLDEALALATADFDDSPLFVAVDYDWENP